MLFVKVYEQLAHSTWLERYIVHASSQWTDLWVPQSTGHTQVLAASHESVGLGRLARLAVAEVSAAVERVLAHRLCHKPTVHVHGVFTRDQLSTFRIVLTMKITVRNIMWEGFTEGNFHTMMHGW